MSCKKKMAQNVRSYIDSSAVREGDFTREKKLINLLKITGIQLMEEGGWC